MTTWTPAGEVGPSSPAPPITSTGGSSPRPAPSLGGGVRNQRGGQPTGSPDEREEAQFQQGQITAHEEAVERARNLPAYQGTPRPMPDEQREALPQPGELLGELAYSPVWQTAPLVADGNETFNEIVNTINWVQAEEPVLVMDLLRSGWAMMATPEMIAHTRSVLGLDNGEAIAMLESLIPNLPEYEQENIDAALAETPLVAEFFEETKHLWTADERLFMMTVLASLPASSDYGYHPRDTVVSSAMQWLRGTEGTAGSLWNFGGVGEALQQQAEYGNRIQHLSQPEVRQSFFIQFYQWARQQQQEHYGRQSGVGAVGAALATPANTVSRGLNWLFYGLGDPEEWQWREGLSFGQNIAISQGYDPGDGWGYTMTSGAIDAFNQFFLDPLNLVAGWGLGAKLAKTIALTPRLASMSRWARVLGAITPITNRAFTRLPRFSRSLGARVAWSLMAKPEEAMIELAAKNGVFTRIYDILHGPGGVAELLELFPSLRPIADDFVHNMLMLCPDPEAVQEAFVLAAKGQFTQGEKGVEGIRFLQRLQQLAGDDYETLVRRGLGDGTISPMRVQPGTEGLRPQVYGVTQHVGRGVPTGVMETGPERIRLAFERFGEIVGLDDAGKPIFLRNMDEVDDFTGLLLFPMTKEDGSLFTAADDALSQAGHLGPARPTAYDKSQCIVLPADWRPSAILFDNVKGAAAAQGTVTREARKLFNWLTSHPSFHHIPEATATVANAANFFVRATPRAAMRPLKVAMLDAFEGVQKQWVNAWWMRQQGLTLAKIAEHFKVDPRTVGRWVKQGEELVNQAGGLGAIRPGTRLIDMNEMVSIKGDRFRRFQTEDGTELWALADLGVRRISMSYDQMAPATRLYALLNDLYAATGSKTARTQGAAEIVGDILARIYGDAEVRSLLLRYAETLGSDIDEIRLISRALPGLEDTVDFRLITAHGAKRMQRASFFDASTGPADAFRSAFDAMMQRRSLFERIQAGGSRTIWVKDFPTEIPNLLVKKLWRAHASNDAKGWWGYVRRLVSAKFFNPRYRPLFRLGSIPDVIDSVGVFLRRIGLPETFIRKWINDLINTPKGERLGVLRACVREASDEVKFPLFKNALVEYVEKQGIRTYAAIDKGGGVIRELGIAAGRDRGQAVAVPFLPSHMAVFAQLPGEQFFRSLRRTRRTQRWRRVLPGQRLKHVYERQLGGWIPATQKRRATLATEFKNKMRQAVTDGHLTQAEFDQFTDADWMAMAYATVWRSKTDKGGLGAVAQAARILGKTYIGIHSVFSVAQLLLRPFAWAGRVLLEEQFRGSFFDLPSLSRNPFRMMAAWTDTAMIELTHRWQAQNRMLMHQIITDIFKDAPRRANVDQMLELARKTIPDIDQYLTRKSLTSASKVRAAVAHVLSKSFLEETNSDILKGTRYLTRRVVRRTRLAHIGRERMKEMGLNPDFSFVHGSNVPDIMNKSFGRIFVDDVVAAGSVPVQMTGVGMTIEQTHRYSVALGRSIFQLGNDAVMRHFGLKRVLHRFAHGSNLTSDAYALRSSPWWYEIRTNVRRMADWDIEHSGLDPKLVESDVTLSEWFLDSIIDPYTEYMYGWMWKGLEGDEAINVVGGLYRLEPVEIKVGNGAYVIDLHASHEGSLVKTVEKMVSEQSMVPNHGLPPTVTSHWDAKYVFEEGSPDSLGAVAKHTARFIMALAGDKWSQYLNRRPAWLSAYRDHYRYFLDRGFAPEAAQQAAHYAATDIVNRVYYNMENAVPFLRAFSKVSPFFTAWWEVAQTWAYKIPNVWGWPVGVPTLIRKVDRMIQGLVKCGLLEIESEPSPDSPIGTRSMRLRLDPHAMTGNPLGDVMSQALYHFLSTPVTFVTHLLGIRNMLGWDDYQSARKDVWQLAVGNPLDFWSHGIMGVNQAYLGLNPLGTFAASKILTAIPAAVDYDQEETQAGETVAALAERWDTSPSAIYNLNRGAFIDLWGEDVAKDAFAGRLSPELLHIETPLSLKVPGTSLIVDMIDPFFFPFGREDTVAGTFWDFIPGYGQHILRGWGLWEGASSGLEPDDVIPNIGFLSAGLPPETRAGLAGEILVQMMHLEAEEQLMTRVTDASNRVAALINQNSVFLGLEELGNGYDYEITENQDSPQAVEFSEALEEAQRLESELLTRAMNNAGASGVIKGIAGFFAPAIPRMLFHEQELVLAFHQARELTQGDIEMEQMVLPALRGGDEDLMRQVRVFNDMVGAWLSEPVRGSYARYYLQRNFPELLPFTMGKTYWGPNGESPGEQTMNDYSDDLHQQVRLPYPPLVFLQQYARSSNSFSKEVAIVQQYGNDPVVAASRVVQNYAVYRDLLEPFDSYISTMDWADDFFYQGAFLEWRERNREDNATFISELVREAEWDIRTLEEWSVNADEVLSMDADERSEFVGKMKAIVSALRTGINDWRDRFGEAPIESPRQAALAEYFTSVGDYYDHLADLYVRIDEAVDSEDRSRLFDEIRNYQNTEGMAPVYVEGVRFPSVLEWWWNAKTADEQEAQLYRWVASKPEWLNLFAAQRLVERVPAAAQYLPTTPEQMRIYDTYNAIRSEYGDMFEPDAWTSLLSGYGQGEQNRMYGNLQDALSIMLSMEGRNAEVAFREMVPIQRLSVLGLLPQTLQAYVPKTNMILETLRAQELSPGSDMADDLFGFVWVEMMRDINWNPRIGEDLVTLGENMWDEDTYDMIFRRLFQGEYAGEV